MYYLLHITIYICIHFIYICKRKYVQYEMQITHNLIPRGNQFSSFWEYHFLDTLSLISVTQISTSFFNIQMNSFQPPAFVSAGNPVSP